MAKNGFPYCSVTKHSLFNGAFKIDCMVNFEAQNGTRWI